MIVYGFTILCIGSQGIVLDIFMIVDTLYNIEVRSGAHLGWGEGGGRPMPMNEAYFLPGPDF